MAVGIGAHQFRGDLGAIHRAGLDPEVGAHDGDVETRVVKQFKPRGVAQKRGEMRCLIAPLFKPHQMGGAVPR